MPHSLNEDAFMKLPLVQQSIKILSTAILSVGLLACQADKKKNANTSNNTNNLAATSQCQSGMDATDKQAMERTAEMYSQFSANSDKIWSKNYRLDKTPLMYVRRINKKDACAYLINHPKAVDLDTATLIETAKDGSMPDVYRLNTIPNAENISKISNFDFNHEISGVPTFVMKYNSEKEDPFSAPNSHDWTLFVAHEGMHNFQLAGGDFKETSGTQDFENYPLNEEHIALILLEQKLFERTLKLILADTDSSGLNVIIRQLISVRETRLKQWPAVKTHDLYQEQTEGTARYVEHTLGSLLKFDRINLESFVEMVPSTPDANIRESLAFGRFYFTGSVLSHILNTKDVANWQSKVEQGQSPYSILANQYALNAATLAAELAQAKAANSFTDLQQKAKIMAVQAAKEPTDIFAN